MKTKGTFVLREIAGDYIIVPVGESAMEFNGMITLNEIGVFIWKLLQEEHSYDEILHTILNEYDSTEEQVRKDLDDFLEQMREANLIQG